MSLPAIYREAAELADGIAPDVAVWVADGKPASKSAAEALWDSFRGPEYVKAGNVAVLGLLLLAEVIESAE